MSIDTLPRVTPFQRAMKLLEKMGVCVSLTGGVASLNRQLHTSDTSGILLKAKCVICDRPDYKTQKDEDSLAFFASLRLCVRSSALHVTHVECLFMLICGLADKAISQGYTR